MSSEHIWIICFTIILIVIALNSYSKTYFRRKLKQAPHLPVVNMRGEVVGKSLAETALQEGSIHIYPVIRIALVNGGKLVLTDRPPHSAYDANRLDLPIEGHLMYGENVEHALRRIYHVVMKHAGVHQSVNRQKRNKIQPEGMHFHLAHYYETHRAKRYIYLFTWELSEAMLTAIYGKGNYKPWTLQQIKENLGKNFFADCFEQEFELLEEIVSTREKYK